MKIIHSISIFFAAFLMGCSSSRITHSWKAENILSKKYNKILVLGLNRPSRLYYVQKGKVKTYKSNEDGKELVIGLYTEGDFLEISWSWDTPLFPG